MEKLIVNKFDSVFFQIECNEAQRRELREYFTQFAANYFFHPKFKSGIWNGKVSFFIRGDLLPIGLAKDLVKFCDKFRYKLELGYEPSEFGDESINEEYIKDFASTLLSGTEYELRDYQLKAATKALRRKRGIAELATGSGKSISLYTIVRHLVKFDNTILIIVPSVSLVEQIYSDFKSYGWKDIKDYCCKLYGNGKLENKQVLISTWQSLYRKPKEFFEKYDALLIDECHKTKENSIREIAINCSKAEYRIGFTGTMPDHVTDKMMIEGYIGPVLHKVKSQELIDRGILSTININALICKYPQELRTIREYKDEVDFTIGYKPRNNVLSHIFSRIDKGENTLILASRIEHLKTIERYCKIHFQNHTVEVIYGEVSAKDREDIRTETDKKKNVILLGTYATMSTGINIKRIHHVVFFSSYKSKITILQSIGRGLRTHASKNGVTLWDVVDDMSIKVDCHTHLNFGMKHFKARYEYYNEQGFPMIVENLKI